MTVHYQDPEEDPETWGFFDWGSYAEKWEVRSVMLTSV